MLEVTEEHHARERAHRADAERRRLLEHLVEVQDRERALLAADLHDGPVQWVTAALLRIQALRGRDPSGPVEQECSKVEHLLERTIRSLRGLLFELDPPSLDREGLGAALREQLDLLSREDGLTCRLEEDGLGREPGCRARRIAFRIAQEALRNVRKHAQAQSVRLRLGEEHGGISLEVTDDGRGFDPGLPTPDGHRGLASMRERAEFAGGHLEVRSSPGAGTTVKVWLPDP